jgi:hypothetical protein
MDSDVLTIFLALLGAVAVITAFFYGGALVLHWLEVPDSPQTLAMAAEQRARNQAAAAA